MAMRDAMTVDEESCAKAAVFGGRATT